MLEGGCPAQGEARPWCVCLFSSLRVSKWQPHLLGLFLFLFIPLILPEEFLGLGQSNVPRMVTVSSLSLYQSLQSKEPVL